MTPELVYAAGRVTVTVSAELSHVCPFVAEVDHGTVTIGWTTQGQTLELHSLRAWLDTFTGEVISHEDLSGWILEDLSALHGLTGVTVSTSWQTADMRVGVDVLR